MCILRNAYRVLSILRLESGRYYLHNYTVLMCLSNVSPPTLRFARWAIVLALCFSVGLQWVVLQGIAWTGMMIKFSQQDSIAEAVSKTFDGEHPCPLCKAVQNGMDGSGQSDDTSTAPSSKDQELKLTLALVLIPQFAFPKKQTLSWPTAHEVAVIRQEQPETPPPQCGC